MKKVYDACSNIPGVSDVLEDFVQKMNQAAELAARKCLEVLVDAVRNMTLEDGLKCVRASLHPAPQDSLAASTMLTRPPA